MKDKSDNIEDLIVETTWTDRDNDIVVQAQIDEELGLKGTDELEQ